MNELELMSCNSLFKDQDIHYSMTVNDDDDNDDDDSVVDSYDKLDILEVRQSLPIKNAIHFNGFWCCLVTLSLVSVGDSTFLKVPNNTVILKRKSRDAIDMMCKSDCHCNLLWSVRKNRNPDRELLYNGYFLHPDAKSYCTVVTDEPGKCNLRLRNTAETAQTYICLEPGSLREASADLIWLDDLICNTSSIKELVILTCRIDFRGNWAPTMEWKEHGSLGEKVLSVGVSTDIVPNQRVNSTLVMAVQGGSKKYTCTIKFDISGKPPHTTATNIPEYTHTEIVRQQDKPEGKVFKYVLILPLFAIMSVMILRILIMCKNEACVQHLCKRFNTNMK